MNLSMPINIIHKRSNNAKRGCKAAMVCAILMMLTAFSLLLAMFAFSVSADEELPMYAALAAVTERSDNGIIIDKLTSTATWTSPDNSARLSSAGTPRIILQPNEGVSDFGALMTLDSEHPLDLSEQSEICAHITVYSKAEFHKIEMTVSSDTASVTYTAIIPSGDVYALYAPLDSLSGRNDIRSVEIRIYDEEARCTSAVITELSAYSAGAARNAEKYCFTAITASEGGIAASTDGITLIAGKSGAVEATAASAYNDHSKSEETVGYSMNITVEQSATLTFFAGYDDACIELTTLNLSPSTEYYYVSLPSGHPLYIKLRITFDDRDGEATLHSIKYLQDTIHKESFEYQPISTISEFKYDASSASLVMRGTLPSSSVIEHINSELAIFAFRMSESEYDLTSSNAIAKTKISTKFEFTVAADKLPYDLTLYRYVLAIIDKSDIIPVSELMYPDLSVGDSSYYGSKVALHGGLPSNAFEANASNVIVDISLPLLTGGSEPYRTGTLVTRGTRYYYLNKKYIDELQGQVKLYDALGISVYLRLLVDADMSSDEAGSLSFGGSSDAELYAVNINDPSGENLFLACAEYLSEQFPKIKGFVLGSAIDDNISNYASPEASLAERAELHAKTLAMLYKTAVLNAPNIAVYTSISDNSPDACHLTALVSEALVQYGDISWSLVIESAYYDKNASDRCELIGEQILGVAVYAPHDITVLWQIASKADDRITEIYTALCTSNDAPLISAYFLSLNDIASSGDLYENLKLTINEANRITESFNADTVAPVYTGKYKLWDFQNEYSTLGWLNGGGCDSLNSQRAQDGSRCLSARLTSDERNAFDGLMLCMLSDEHLLSSSPIVAVELGISGVDGDAELTISFGDGEMRAEYSISLTNLSKATIYCDLSKYGHINAIDYIATSLSGHGSDVKLDIYSVYVASRSLTDEELSGIFESAGESQDTDSTSVTNTAVVAFMAIVLALSGITFALLSKSNFDNNHDTSKRKKEF